MSRARPGRKKVRVRRPNGASGPSWSATLIGFSERFPGEAWVRPDGGNDRPLRVRADRLRLG